MNVYQWLTSWFSPGGRALAHYRRGMARAHQGDYQGAIDAYTAAIAIPEVPVDVKAMVLYNRALAVLVSGANQEGIGDLDAVLALEAAPLNVKTMARQKLLRMEARTKKASVP